MAAGSRSSHGYFVLSSTFQTHFVQLVKPSLVFVKSTGIQALPSPVIYDAKFFLHLGCENDSWSLHSLSLQYYV